MSQPSQPSQSSPYKIFITYRREDSQDTCGFLYYRLKEHFGRDAVFKDVDSIPAGYSFPGYINHVLGQCRVVLVVIGPGWLTVIEQKGAYAGQIRLNNPEDRVRIEVERALALSPVDAAGRPTSDLLLIPLLVQSAEMPETSLLPASLRPLTERNARRIRRDPDFEQDIQRLIGVIAQWMGVADLPNVPASTVTPPSPQPAVPTNDLVARLLPQIYDAFNAQDWPQVERLIDYLQQHATTDEIPTAVYQMQGRAHMAERDYAGAKAAWDAVCARDPLDVAALRAAAEARIALGRAGKSGELVAALPLLKSAITFTNDRGQRLALLRITAQVLTTLAQAETGATAQTHWNELLLRANEGLRLAGEQDAGWLSTKLEALQGLGRDAEALEVTRQLTALPNASATLWLMHARLGWKQAGESPTDEVRSSLDAAARLAPSDVTIMQARQEMLAILKPDRFPVRLAQLGFTANKRNGVAFIAPPVCPVPAGDFLMGSDPRRDKDARSDEQPQKSIPVAAFAIGRFPVTVAEYACFVEDKTTGQRQPSAWANQLQKLDHPVVWVSWDDAVAYAAWLAKMTGQLWRLPTEAEWEKAARWDARAGVARLYPWGDTFDPARANTSEGGKQGTIAVGSYPNGASPYGAEEMAGNVWEWTHSLYKPYPYTGSDGREVEKSTENRVLRGGSWGYYSQDARAAYRYQGRAVALISNVGFRLALGGPGSA